MVIDSSSQDDMHERYYSASLACRALLCIHDKHYFLKNLEYLCEQIENAKNTSLKPGNSSPLAEIYITRGIESVQAILDSCISHKILKGEGEGDGTKDTVLSTYFGLLSVRLIDLRLK